MREDANYLWKVLLERSAIVRGHFVLSSGLHSDTYVQCAKLFEVPEICERLCALLLKKAHGEFLDADLGVDLVVSPAVGGVVFGYEVARQLGVRFVFFEREDGCFVLRRNFTINRGDKVIIVEDVVTTGGASLEVAQAVGNVGGEVVGELSIVRRSNCTVMPFPLVSLLDLEIENYKDTEVPEHLMKVPVSKPGSKYLTSD